MITIIKAGNDTKGGSLKNTDPKFHAEVAKIPQRAQKAQKLSTSRKKDLYIGFWLEFQ